MSPSAKRLAAGGVLLAALAASTWFLASSTRPSPPVPVAAREIPDPDAVGTPTGGPPVESFRVATRPQSEPDDPPRPGSLSAEDLETALSASIDARVTDPDGRPVPGALVRLEPAGDADPADEALVFEAETDRSGSVRIPVPETGSFSIAASRDGFAPARLAPVRPGSSVLLRLQPARALVGRILDPDGRAVEGALLLAGEQEARSGPDGRFSLRGIGRQGEMVGVLAPGFRVERVLLIPSPREVTVVLRQAKRIPGSVATEHGSPVAGATVRLLAEFELGEEEREYVLDETRTSPDGTFVIRAATDEDAKISATADGYLPAVLELDGEIPSRADLVLHGGRALEGVVRLPGGAPAAGAVVRVLGASREYASRRRVVAGEDGRFSIERVRGGRIRIGAAHPAGSALVREVDLDTASAAHLTLELPPPNEVVLVCTLSDGRPAAFAEVTIDHDDPGVVRLCDARGRFRADASGRVAVRNLLPGRWSAIARAARASGSTGFDVVAGRDQTVAVALEGAAVVRGRVLDENGRPLTPVRIRADHERPGGAREVLTDASGRFELTGFVAGDFVRMEARMDGYVDRSMEAVARLDPPEILWTLARARAITGRVVDAVSGLPVERFSVAVTTGDGENTRTRKRGVRSPDGLFRIDDVSPGSALLEVRADGYHPYGPEVIDLAHGDADVEVRLAPAGEIRGRLIDRRGRPVAGVFARIEPTGDGDLVPRRSRSLPDGTFRIRRVAAGRYDFFAGLASAPQAERTLAVDAGPVDLGDLRLDLTGALAVRVTDPVGRPLEDRPVHIEGIESGAEAVLSTGPDGIALFDPVLADNYIVRSGGERETLRVEANRQSSVELTVEPDDEPQGSSTSSGDGSNNSKENAK